MVLEKAKKWRLYSEYGEFRYRFTYSNHVAWMLAMGLKSDSEKDKYKANEEIRVDFQKIKPKEFVKPSNAAFGGDNNTHARSLSAVELKAELDRLKVKRSDDPNIFDRQAMK